MNKKILQKLVVILFLLFAIGVIFTKFANALSTLTVQQGGTGVGTVTGIIKGNGTSPFSAIVSGTDIKTINGITILGSGDIATPQGTVTSVSGTSNRITSTGGATPVLDISATFEALLGKVASPLSQFAATTSLQLKGVISDETGSGALVFADTPTFTTPNLGSATASGLTLSSITGSTQCLHVDSSGVVSGTGSDCGTGAGGASTALDNLASVAINTSLISDTNNTDDLGSALKQWKDIYIDGTAYLDAIDLNGTGLTSTGTQLNYLSSATGTTGTTSTNLVFSTSPTLTTPTLGVASATSINKVAITAPATSATLTIADGKTLTANSSLTLAGADSKTLTVNKTMTLTAADDTGVYTFPTGTKTLLATDGSAASLTNFPTFNQNTTGSAASLSISGQTGLLTFTGLASTNRIKTVRDAADTILELGGSYTPTGTWTSLKLNENVALTTTSTKLNYLTSATGTTGTTSTNVVFSTSPTLTTPALDGTVTGTGVATGATASTLAQRDSNGNITADNWLGGYTTTATAAGTTTLTVDSTYLQYFTGSSTQTVKLPVVSTLALGTQYVIVNNSTGNVTVQSSGANTITVLAGSTSTVVTSIATTGTDATVWSSSYSAANVASGKKLTVNNTLTLSGTDSTTMTFPTTSATIARTDAANTFTGASTASAWVLTSPTITTGITPTSDDGAALGSTSNKFSDLFLASGAVINFNSGNATLTHSAGLLTSNVNIAVPDDAYAAGWDGSVNVPTKNAVYDKIQTLSTQKLIGVGESSNTTYKNIQYLYGSANTVWNWTSKSTPTYNYTHMTIGSAQGIGRPLDYDLATGADIDYANTKKKVIEWEARVQADASTGTSCMGIAGVTDASDWGSFASKKLIGFATNASGSWFIVTQDGTTTSSTGISTPSAGKHTFRIEIDQVTPLITFYIDGSSVGTKAVNIPTSGAISISMNNGTSSVIIQNLSPITVAIEK